MKRPGYREAIQRMVLNDDTTWVEDDEPIISVTAAMIADLFDVDQKKVIQDIQKGLKKND